VVSISQETSKNHAAFMVLLWGYQSHAARKG